MEPFVLLKGSVSNTTFLFYIINIYIYFELSFDLPKPFSIKSS